MKNFDLVAIATCQAPTAQAAKTAASIPQAAERPARPSSSATVLDHPAFPRTESAAALSVWRFPELWAELIRTTLIEETSATLSNRKSP